MSLINRGFVVSALAPVVLGLGLTAAPSSAFAVEADETCRNVLKDTNGIGNPDVTISLQTVNRGVYRVTGYVRIRGQQFSFVCLVRNNAVFSLNYSGGYQGGGYQGGYQGRGYQGGGYPDGYGGYAPPRYRPY